MAPAHPPLGSESEQFLWHLKPPWIREYSHEHWWADDTEAVGREAAIWEILRRHPYSWWFLIWGLVDTEHDGVGDNWSQDEQLIKDSLPVYWQRRRKQFLNLMRFAPALSWRRREKDIDLTLSAYAHLSWDELPKREQRHWEADLTNQLDSQHGFRTADDIYGAFVIPNVVELPRDALRKLRNAAKRHGATATKCIRVGCVS